MGASAPVPKSSTRNRRWGRPVAHPVSSPTSIKHGRLATVLGPPDLLDLRAPPHTHTHMNMSHNTHPIESGESMAEMRRAEADTENSRPQESARWRLDAEACLPNGIVLSGDLALADDPTTNKPLEFQVKDERCATAFGSAAELAQSPPAASTTPHKAARRREVRPNEPILERFTKG